VDERGIFDDESGGEHAGGEFSAVQTVAYEDLGDIFAFDWLEASKSAWVFEKIDT
jgi:hypothetical protein